MKALSRYYVQAMSSAAHQHVEDPADFEEGCAALYEKLKRSHRPSARRQYHVWRHIAAKVGWTLKLYEAHLDAAEWGIAPNLLADFYHDSVYDPQRSDNEEQSCEELHTDILALFHGCEANSDLIKEARRLIMLTKGHDIQPADWRGSIMVDSDLAILQSDRETYAKYAEGIVKEYAYAGKAAYSAGRINVLRHFLELAMNERLFHHPELSHRDAVENISWEIGLLEKEN